jgi:hypothetical protein
MNHAISFFWTTLCFIPIIGFWMAANCMQLLYVVISISFFSLAIPAKVLQLSRNPKFYEGLGVKFIRKLVQNGEYANRFIRKNNPQYNLIKNKTQAERYIRTVKMYERYHFLCFIFFLLSAIYAVITLHYTFFTLILIANIIYNICPMLLQQYNGARGLRLNK